MTTNTPTKKQVLKMLEESNAIEQVYDESALNAAYMAWKYALENKNKLSVDVILDIHALLMTGLNPRIAGKIRNCDVYIGGQRKWFMSEAIIKEELDEVIRLINSGKFDRGMEEEYAKHVHVMFENVHPFEDGNGRTGRILYNLHRLKLGLPIHIIMADWPKKDGQQRAYYEWFRN